MMKKEKRSTSASRRWRDILEMTAVFGTIFLCVFVLPQLLYHPKTVVVPGYTSITFDDLVAQREPGHRWSAAMGDAPALVRVTPHTQALKGTRIAIAGFMVPTDSDLAERVKRFALVPHQASCCFGGNPRVDQLIMVTMAPGKEARFEDVDAVVVSGTLNVLKDEIDRYSASGLYEILADAVQKV